MILICGTGWEKKLGLMQLEITVKTEIAKGELEDTVGQDDLEGNINRNRL